MGNQICTGSIGDKDLQVPHLKQRNSYGQARDNADQRILKSVFSQSYQENRNSKVLEMIETNREHLFEDPNFPLNDKNSLRLSVLFNYEANRTRIYTTREQTDITNFIQITLQFSYLTSVFYLLCRRQNKSKLLPRIIQNQQTNLYGAYSTNLYCNGEKHNVIIDDRMPTQNDNFLFLRVVKGVELWPLILEKAWCKMIGSYQKAKGLSPEDAFEEITGIPAYTYTIKANNRETIRSVIDHAMRNKYWVSLIAHSGLEDLQNRQVFHVISVDLDQFRLISPYVSFSFDRYHQKTRGEVTVHQQDIFSHFEYVIVGFVKQNYVPVSINIKSKPRQQLIFELNVSRKEDVSIRFNQLFNGYFNPEYRGNYQYSPILIELYQITMKDGKRKCRILDHCQGCFRTLNGARSSQCSNNIMESLQGKYIIRLQVDWIYPALINSGSLVVYGSEGNIQLTQLKNSNLKQNVDQILFKEIYPDIFEHDGTNSIILHEHSLEVHTFDKEKTTLIEFHNVTSEVCHFQADFSKSVNILLRGEQIKGNQAYIRLKADQKTIVEVLPKDLKKHIQIQNFQINKLPVK